MRVHGPDKKEKQVRLVADYRNKYFKKVFLHLLIFSFST